MTSARRALVVAAAWGLAEATVFFIVPDVWLSFMGMRSARRGIAGCACAVAGALIGGAVMFELGRHAPAEATRLLEAVPGIHAATIDIVRAQIADHGLWAILAGPIRGRPYKIYAVEWARAGGALAPFLCVSIPARAARFLLSVGVAAVFGRVARVSTRRDRIRGSALLAGLWVVFYAAYFRATGW